MAILPTLITIIAGVALGFALGGSVDRARQLRPDLLKTAAVALAIQVILQLTGISGGWAVAIDVITKAVLLAAAIFNLRIGGMVVVAAGLFLNIAVTLINGGMPTSRNALVHAGLIDAGETGVIKLSGPRHVAEGDLLSFLGEVIALPTKQVVSFGDLLILIGGVLVIMAIFRGRVLPRDAAPISVEQVDLSRFIPRRSKA